MNALPWLAGLFLFFAITLSLFTLDELLCFIRRAILGFGGGNTFSSILIAIFASSAVSAWITFFFEVNK